MSTDTKQHIALIMQFHLKTFSFYLIFHCDVKYACAIQHIYILAHYLPPTLSNNPTFFCILLSKRWLYPTTEWNILYYRKYKKKYRLWLLLLLLWMSGIFNVVGDGSISRRYCCFYTRLDTLDTVFHIRMK